MVEGCPVELSGTIRDSQWWLVEHRDHEGLRLLDLTPRVAILRWLKNSQPNRFDLLLRALQQHYPEVHAETKRELDKD